MQKYTTQKDMCFRTFGVGCISPGLWVIFGGTSVATGVLASMLIGVLAAIGEAARLG